ncbi:MAG: hypothetical protein VYE77_02730 [Planctomycetota bacterium]|nr:hypothetical protein [Planctomycetota bacterium]
MQLILAHLREDPQASYADIRDAAAEQGMKIYPIMYGRALALLGLVEVAPRGTRKRKLAEREMESGADAIESMVAAVRQAEQDRARYKAALQAIARTLRSVLDEEDQD